MGAGSVLLNFMFFHMIRWTSPAVTTMIKRTAIVFVLFVDIIFYSVFPNDIAIVGHCIVVISSIVMVLAPKIEEKLCPSDLIAIDESQQNPVVPKYTQSAA